MTMIRKTLLSAVSTAVSVGAVFADWTLVDDMNYADQAAMDAVWKADPIDTDGENGGPVRAEDPADSTNLVLQMNMGAPIVDDTYNARAIRSLPAGSEITGMGTTYFRIKVPTVDVGGTSLRAVVDLVWGLSTREPIADPATPDPVTEVEGGYNDFSVLARNDFDASFDVYDFGNPDGSYQTVLVDGTTADEWYQIWYVSDHVNNAFKVYAQGGTEFPTQTLVYPDPDTDTHPPIGWSAERSPSLESLKTFLMYSSAGSQTTPKGLDFMFIDDIYVDNTGENLSSPTGGPGQPGDAEFYNISTRGNVGTGADRIIGGFVVKGVAGTSTGTVLIRAIGPGLGALGVPGTLEDPVLEIFDSSSSTVPVLTNDNWGTGDNSDADEIKAASTLVGAFGIADGSLDAVVLVALPPGAYTAIISGNGGTTGVAIIEVYAVD